MRCSFFRENTEKMKQGAENRIWTCMHRGMRAFHIELVRVSQISLIKVKSLALPKGLLGKALLLASARWYSTNLLRGSHSFYTGAGDPNTLEFRRNEGHFEHHP